MLAILKLDFQKQRGGSQLRSRSPRIRGLETQFRENGLSTSGRENLVAEPLVWQAARDTLLAGCVGSLSHALHREGSSLLWMADNGQGGGGRSSLSDVSIQTQPRKDSVLAGKSPISERERDSQN